MSNRGLVCIMYTLVSPLIFARGSIFFVRWNEDVTFAHNRNRNRNYLNGGWNERDAYLNLGNCDWRWIDVNPNGISSMESRLCNIPIKWGNGYGFIRNNRGSMPQMHFMQILLFNFFEKKRSNGICQANRISHEKSRSRLPVSLFVIFQRIKMDLNEECGTRGQSQ